MTKYDGRVNIYIKKEDRPKWDAIEDKPEWLHEHLNMPKLTRVQISSLEPVSPHPKPNEPYLFSTTTKSVGVLTEDFLEEPKLTPPENTA